MRRSATGMAIAQWGLLLSVLSPAVVMAQSDKGVTRIVVDAAAAKHPISPYIYGVAFASTAVLADLNLSLNRSGGNSASMYNWQLNARNSGRDWFFESVACKEIPMDQFGDNFVELTQKAGAKAMLTVPMIGWVAKLGPNRTSLASFDITRYGLQRKTDIHGMTEAGDGVSLDGLPIKNDPRDAAEPDSIDRERDWMRHIVTRWKPAAKGGVQFFLLDNEPARWFDAHHDVAPVGLHAKEMAAKTVAFSRMVKAVDPTAKVVAPEEWLPTALHQSGFDQQLRENHDTSTPTDRATQTGGMDMLPWLLTQWKAAGTPVDVVSVHFYPQGGEYRDGGDDISERTQMLRNRSTRLLWDKSYKDTTSWINDTVALIPRMRELVDTNYVRGTPIAITEYNWGAEKSMNGATVQADILGIFGREGLYMASRWIAPAEGSPTYLAMKLFRNYDGHRSGFGETSVSASTPDVDRVSAFAALRDRDKALTVIAVNKQIKEPAPVNVTVANIAGNGSYEVYRVVDGRLDAVPPASYRDGNVLTVLPPQSVTMFIFHPDGGSIALLFPPNVNRQ
jgi:hypothetical protein